MRSKVADDAAVLKELLKDLQSYRELFPITSSGDSKGKELAIAPEAAQGVIPIRSGDDSKGKALVVVPESALGVIPISSIDSTHSENSFGRSKMPRLS